jgi:D-alanyl-D-alanine carboxypeptidase (penicillin-binding protein 5/6)
VGSIPCRANLVELRPPEAATAILVEPTTGQILYEKNPDVQRAPASIAKLMLELIVMERVERGELRLDEPIRASAWASKMGGSQVFLAHGEEFPLSELMKAIAIASANDACVAVAEHIAGTTEGFVDLMNIRARDLGLKNTRYINVHGLDDEPGTGNVTTARDIAVIAAELVKYPHVLEWSSIVEAPFRNGEFTLNNTNKLLGDFAGLDGLKTGFTNRAGYCLCATAHRNGMRLVSVILGSDSNRLRFRETARLLGAGFAQMRKSTIVEEGKPVAGEVPVADGRRQTLEVVAGERIDVVLPERGKPPLPTLIPAIGLRAPIAAGDTVGTIEVRANGVVQRAPALAANEMKRATIFQRIGRFLGADR